MTHDPSAREPLTPEEQALARRLAQLGQREPSPALDARILAAARDAGAPARRIHPRPWPIAVGVAASLVLAVGIAWHLRPLPLAEPPPPTADREAPVRYIAPPPELRTAPAAPPPALAKPVPASTPTPTPPSPSVALPRMAAPPPMVEAPPPPESPEAPVVLDAPAPAAAVAAASAAGLPPAPPPASLPAPSAQSEPAPAAMRKAAATDAETEDKAVNAAAEAEQAAGDEPDTEVPPATADSPEVRQAWLQRIRELAAAGQAEAARASLKEFVRRHPDAPLPDDLRALQR